MATSSRILPRWKGKNDKIIFSWNDTQLALPALKSWDLAPQAEVAEDDYHDQDRTDTVVVLKYYELNFEYSQEGLELLEVFLDNQENEDQNAIPQDGWMGIRIKKNDGTSVRLAGSGMTLMPWKMGSPARAQNNTFNATLRIKYLKRA